MWTAVAQGWADHADWCDEREESVTLRLLAGAAPRPGERVLELACGAGGVGLAAAERVGAGGAVVLSDVAPAMTAIAARRAQERGLTAVSTAEHDLEEIDAPDASFDVVLCRQGLMLAADPARAVREVLRVLRPGGRLAFAVWGPREANPWLGLVFDAVGRELGMAFPPPGLPGPFSLADQSHLGALLVDAGAEAVSVDAVACPAAAAGFGQWWERIQALAGPLPVLLASLTAEQRAAIEADLRVEAEPYRRNGNGLLMPGVALVASGRRAQEPA